jgi:methyl-accepting chemotaxis protein
MARHPSVSDIWCSLDQGSMAASSRRLRHQVFAAVVISALAAAALGALAEAGGLMAAVMLGVLILPAGYFLASVIAGPVERLSERPQSADLAALAESSGEAGAIARRLKQLSDDLAARSAALDAQAAAAQQAELRLRDAVDSISEGFVMYDAGERHLLHNRHYQDIYDLAHDDEGEIGLTMEQILRRDLAAGRYAYAETGGDSEAWLRKRLAQFREAAGTVEYKLKSGRWVRVTDRRTPAGNTVGIRTDITAEKVAEIKLREALEESSRKSERLSAVVDQVTEGVTAIKSETAQLAAGAQELSSRTEEQVASLQEMASAIRQWSVTQAQGAERMDQAKQIVEAARTAAQSGSTAADGTIAAMQRIEESSTRISEIIGLIEEIAFQTNLLALNAAVEAARAGDAGRGFAVVATEVRALAHRAGAASKEVRSLIANSSSQVASGVELVGKSAATLGMIVASVRRAADMITEIAASSREQSIGVRQVDESVNLLENLTQKNAELVEGTSAAVAAVDGQIETLKQVMDAADQDASVADDGGGRPARSAA